MLERFLFKWDIYDGTHVVAIVSCILSLVGLAYFLYVVITHEDVLFESKADIYTPYLVIVACVLVLIASILLIVALRKDVGWLVILWLFICGIAFMMGYIFFMSSMLKKDYIIGGVSFLLLVAFGYCWLVVYSFYRELYGEEEY